MKQMTLNEAIQEMEEHGYIVKKKSLLEQAKETAKKYGYLVEDEEDDEDGDFEDGDDDDNTSDKGDDHSNEHDHRKDKKTKENTDIKDLVQKLRGIDKYEDFVKELAGLKGYQRNLLTHIVGNGKHAENVELKKGRIPVWKLHPTQNQIDIANSLAFPFENKKNSATNPDSGITKILEAKEPIEVNHSPLLVYKHSDGNYYIIDGHHRWSQVALINRKALMTIYLLNQAADGNESPVDVLRDFQLVVKAETGNVKVATADDSRNIFKWTPEQVHDWVVKKLNAPTGKAAVEAWQAAAGHESDDVNKIADTVKDNAIKMKQKNMYCKGAPERGVMPQTDAKTVQIAAKGMTDV